MSMSRCGSGQTSSSSRGGSGVVEGETASVKVHLTGSLRVTGDNDDGGMRSVLGDETSRVTRLREHNDGTTALLVGSSNCSTGDSLCRFGGQRSQGAKLVKDGGVAEHGLSKLTDFMHGSHSLNGVVALGCLA